MIPVTLNVRVVVSWELENSLPRFRPHGFVDLRKLLGFGSRHGCTEVLTSYLSTQWMTRAGVIALGSFAKSVQPMTRNGGPAR